VSSNGFQARVGDRFVSNVKHEERHTNFVARGALDMTTLGVKPTIKLIEYGRQHGFQMATKRALAI
jgi:hypothetical protein